MTIAHVSSRATIAVHQSRREGVWLGVIVATVIWIWIAAVDAVLGQPFHTFSMLGGVAAFTVMHYLLNITYGIVLLSAIHGAEHAPSLIIAAVFGVITLEGAIAMLTNLLVQARLGSTAWIAVFGGSLVGLAVAFTLVARTHPLATYLRRAEEED